MTRTILSSQGAAYTRNRIRRRQGPSGSSRKQIGKTSNASWMTQKTPLQTTQKATQWTATRNTSSLSWLMPWRSLSVPSKKTSCRYDLLWITRHVKRLIRQTTWANNRVKKSAKDRDWAKFRRKRKNCQKAQKEAHWNYLNQLLEEDSGKSLWQYLKGLRRDTCGVSTLAADGRTGTDPKDKAEMLNMQFSSVFTREDRFNVPTMTTSPHPMMPLIHVGSQGVLKLLQQLNTGKACGGDDIPAILLKNWASELCSMMTFIYQQTIEKKCVPQDWKQALVTPIFKKGNRSCPSNYRPVSLTSNCCKICKHIIVSQTMRHLDATPSLWTSNMVSDADVHVKCSSSSPHMTWQKSSTGNPRQTSQYWTRHRFGSPVIFNLHQGHLGQPIFNHQAIRRWLPGLLRDQIYRRLWCPPRGPEQTHRVGPHLGHGV